MSEPTPDDVETLNSYTPPGLYKFIDVAIKRGDLTQATGTALRVGARKVLDVEKDDNLDLRKLDLDDLIRRFRTLTRLDLSDKTQGTYEDRVRKAVEMYVKYLEGDPTWRPATRAPRPSTKKSTPAKPSTSTTPPVEEAPVVEQVAHTPAPVEEDDNTVMVPVPLSRDGRRKAMLVLPVDMTEKEAKKISGIVELYGMPEQLAITTGDATE